MKILMVLTSHDRLGDTGHKTGFWLEEFAAPYFAFRDAGAEVVLASPDGGKPPLDPKSDDPAAQTEATHRFNEDDEARRALANTLRLDTLAPADYDAVFFPGGHGPLWDLVDDLHAIVIVESFYAAGKPLGAVCHASAVLLNAKAPDGAPLVQGNAVTGFSNSEEIAVGLADVVPFLLEDELKAKGGHYSKVADWQPHVVVDGNLVTGQNPASSEPAAAALLELLGRQ